MLIPGAGREERPSASYKEWREQYKEVSDNQAPEIFHDSPITPKLKDKSRLQNRFFPLQKSAQAKFIPNSDSDLYKVEVVGRRVNMTHPLLFKKEQLAPQDMNKCHLGRKLFNNFTRLQVRNLPVGGGVGK